MKKIDAGRIDAFIFAQEESDFVIRNLKLGKIYRAPYQSFDDGIVLAKGPHGDVIDRILTNAVKKLQETGSLQKLYGAVHQPFVEWQPSEMNWP